MLIIFGGLPGAGKTTIARDLAQQIDATHVRIDSIEQALRQSGVSVVAHGYRIGYAVAEDNLRLGHTVVADSVNPLLITRVAWRDVAKRAAVRAVEVEVICSDVAEHRRRVENRHADVEGLELPTWEEVLARDYQGWEGQHLVIDTARLTIGDAVKAIREALCRAQ